MKKFNLNPSQLAILGVTLTVIGLIGLVPMLYGTDSAAIAAASSSIANPAQIAKQQPVVPQTTSGHAVHIQAPSVSVDMPVVDGFYDAKTGEWTLNSDKAQFAAMTTEPNDKAGQTFVYGHATQRVFGLLLNMKLGAEVYVDTSNSYRFIYTH